MIRHAWGISAADLLIAGRRMEAPSAGYSTPPVRGPSRYVGGREGPGMATSTDGGRYPPTRDRRPSRIRRCERNMESRAHRRASLSRPRDEGRRRPIWRIDYVAIRPDLVLYGHSHGGPIRSRRSFG